MSDPEEVHNLLYQRGMEIEVYFTLGFDQLSVCPMDRSVLAIHICGNVAIFPSFWFSGLGAPSW